MIKDVDTAVGTAATTIGSIGLTIEIVTGFASLVAVLLNIALALGGLYLLWLRIRRARREAE